MKQFSKSVNSWWSYCKKFDIKFFRHSVVFQLCLIAAQICTLPSVFIRRRLLHVSTIDQTLLCDRYCLTAFAAWRVDVSRIGLSGRNISVKNTKIALVVKSHQNLNNSMARLCTAKWFPTKFIFCSVTFQFLRGKTNTRTEAGTNST